MNHLSKDYFIYLHQQDRILNAYYINSRINKCPHFTHMSYRLPYTR